MPNILQTLALGLLLPVLILTKTTGLFLVPSVAYLTFAQVGYRSKPFLRFAIPAVSLAVLLWLGYFLLAVRPHYLLDYRYLFSANGYTRITLATAGTVLVKTFKDGMWMGRSLFFCAMACSLLAVAQVRHLREHPLIPALLLWAGGYAAFLAYHNNLQPRYYLVVAVPLTLLVPVTLEQLLATPPAPARGLAAGSGRGGPAAGRNRDEVRIPDSVLCAPSAVHAASSRKGSGKRDRHP